MTLEFVLSKMLQILKRFWTVDTAAQSVRRGGGDGFVRATGRPLYSRNGVRVSICPRSARNRE
ncbi:MAG: hypothetical protein EOQ42_21020 [Mesorhizobium sp.]|uniref:hypothetical protein n=1 Tax=unclassified Mesorhizobium TaxID=325217 RepID=UPI0007EC453A|nr:MULTISPECIES: hypothetical protein [unclassified Mesorhizobium]RWB27258.1 MAG: hypothetical protein EOQ43_27755 [Mesorhizobium sp.]RWB59328.1 MAG: hypothetical protein EOQ42_21020 [Mesorhizobium sp.]RWC25007.1 MAG: hypothetical protein EOS51_01960 [Mesorhizobium sp.]RWC27993.1 MAG: hypothetical protein EOS70_28480 [Mesorhizobium sp.]RWD85086.1 MAG: hypothetical protein EOS48_02955 [Mesorhizobium sp.]